jgi:hypothetical protein
LVENVDTKFISHEICTRQCLFFFLLIWNW